MRDLEFENLLLQARLELSELKASRPHNWLFDFRFNTAEDIKRAYFPAVEYTVKRGNEFLYKLLSKPRKKTNSKS